MTGPLKNARHEKFCLLVVEGEASGPAYAKAGFKSRSSKARDANAARLIATDKVKARLAELKGAAARRAEVSVDSLCRELDEAAAQAALLEQTSARVQAIMGKARITGHYVGERVNQRTAVSEYTDEEVESEIAALRAKAAARKRANG